MVWSTTTFISDWSYLKIGDFVLIYLLMIVTSSTMFAGLESFFVSVVVEFIHLCGVEMRPLVIRKSFFYISASTLYLRIFNLVYLKTLHAPCVD